MTNACGSIPSRARPSACQRRGIGGQAVVHRHHARPAHAHLRQLRPYVIGDRHHSRRGAQRPVITRGVAHQHIRFQPRFLNGLRCVGELLPRAVHRCHPRHAQRRSSRLKSNASAARANARTPAVPAARGQTPPGQCLAGLAGADPARRHDHRQPPLRRRRLTAPSAKVSSADVHAAGAMRRRQRERHAFGAARMRRGQQMQYVRHQRASPRR